MNVRELIALLQGKPQDMPVAFLLYSEYALLEEAHIEVRSLCLPREDGWVHGARPDKPAQDYLVLPGN